MSEKNRQDLRFAVSQRDFVVDKAQRATNRVEFVRSGNDHFGAADAFAGEFGDPFLHLRRFERSAQQPVDFGPERPGDRESGGRRVCQVEHGNQPPASMEMERAHQRLLLVYREVREHEEVKGGRPGAHQRRLGVVHTFDDQLVAEEGLPC